MPIQLRGENHRLDIITILPDERRLFREPLWVEFKAGERGGGGAGGGDGAGDGSCDECEAGGGFVEMVMDGGDESREMRKSTKKWRDLAREVVDDGGSSQVNLKMFTEQKKFDV
ncbi:hypothetical protein SASPL_134717 [Salvia splendens]|uniref:Uncharacterized protein n=1 Tax=Salvia splendens TaxID=180675 RepID=A0A8X8ZF14_SALSN|nr:hypothetical protein SASPL_134717 [Salvia splendens]